MALRGSSGREAGGQRPPGEPPGKSHAVKADQKGNTNTALQVAQQRIDVIAVKQVLCIHSTKYYNLTA
jgi:hypothetical protein